MKYLLNRDFGGFQVPEEMCEKLNCEWYDDWYTIRTNADFIEWVENHPKATTLEAVELDPSWTDWTLDEYDGLEKIIAVKNGLLKFI